ncbi:MAG: hypothetical protein EZS28_040884 [Streblomastix strix]|uniref:Uncharacterized protein n=1 Tax=Streblomastix strix TaxID=222440 RepID=A0A5J4U023_9EUKA|nr:MAG: hypothetical protein EZS28_040884 [Streblomastix strix]
MVSLGGLDYNAIVVWNATEVKQICGHRIALEYTNFIRFFNNSDESNEIVQGHMSRIWTIAVIDNDDKYVYLGSTTGDIVAFAQSTTKIFATYGYGDIRL